MKFKMVWLASLLALGTIQAQQSSLDDRFIDRYFSSSGDIPLSLTVKNSPSSRSFKGKSPTVTDVDCEGYTERTIRYTEEGISVRLEAKIYSEYDAVEWVAWLKNDGKTNSAHITNINVCDVMTGFGNANDTVIWCRGSDHRIDDFEPMESKVTTEPKVFGTDNGRSSDVENLPFYHVTSSGCGVVVGIGWTGSWQSSVSKSRSNEIALTAGFSKKMDFYLKPGEEVRTPSVVLMFWEGKNRMTGHNKFRRLVLRHFTPQVDGKPVQCPITMPLGLGGPKPCVEFNCTTEEYARQLINRSNEMGIRPDLWWMDAGWYTCPKDNWSVNLGSWTPDPDRFPNGMAPIGKLTREYGQGFLLWFEPERVLKGSWLFENKSEWLLTTGGDHCLLNLGNPEAVEWVSNLVTEYVKRDGLTWYRQDFNMRPDWYWAKNDESNRKGILEIKHIMGLYKFWDNIREACPGLQIDNCASGGRRIDLETIKRSIPLWRTDYEYSEPNGSQSQTYGLSFFLPCHTTGGSQVPIAYRYRSGMTNGVVTAWNINQDGFDSEAAIALLKEHREIRDYFYGDFYPLTPYRNHNLTWIGYQFDLPERNSGIALIFRRAGTTKDSWGAMKFQSLDEYSLYELFYKDFGIRVHCTGKQLMEEGIKAALPFSPASLLIQYKKIEASVK